MTGNSHPDTGTPADARQDAADDAQEDAPVDPQHAPKDAPVEAQKVASDAQKDASAVSTESRWSYVKLQPRIVGFGVVSGVVWIVALVVIGCFYGVIPWQPLLALPILLSLFLTTFSPASPQRQDWYTPENRWPIVVAITTIIGGGAILVLAASGASGALDTNVGIGIAWVAVLFLAIAIGRGVFSFLRKDHRAQKRIDSFENDETDLPRSVRRFIADLRRDSLDDKFASWWPLNTALLMLLAGVALNLSHTRGNEVPGTSGTSAGEATGLFGRVENFLDERLRIDSPGAFAVTIGIVLVAMVLLRVFWYARRRAMFKESRAYALWMSALELDSEKTIKAAAFFDAKSFDYVLSGDTPLSLRRIFEWRKRPEAPPQKNPQEGLKGP